jgi:DNA-binding CsgD family transcriptional regulator
VALTIGIATYFLSASLGIRYDYLALSRGFVPLQLSSLLLGITCYLTWQFIPPSFESIRPALSVVGSGIIGFGTALFCLEGARPFQAIGYHRVLSLGIFSLFCGSVLAYIVTLLPSSLVAPLLMVVSLLMVYCQRRSFRYYPRTELYITKPKLPRYIPWGFLVVALLHGFSLGGMFALLQNLGQPPVFLMHFLAFTAAICLLVLTALFSKLNFNHLIFRLGLPLLAASYFLIALIPTDPLLGNFLLYMGYCYLFLVACCLCAYLGKMHNQSPILIVGLGTSCLLTGQLVGEFIGSLFVENSVIAFAIVMSFVILLLSLILSGTDIAYGWGFVKPGASEYLGSAIAQACEMLADEFRLSRREKEVLLLLVRGRTRRYVSEQLDVSEETVKSHTARIYGKLAVHSHTELISLIEKQVRPVVNSSLR